ncbi:MAG: UDP-N-acetylmuramate dehydrogenase [Deltaproteobacteria bacterium]|nr:UDP-N-acetylmuramate dehydrogenase [Deltaproteobacteria bacterium]MDD9853527.1 UDP-N-acetylmuramate dehydrogenase [Deltaproteobacteria bacterium]MDD9873652.1 UDP-N-acetylmuramate dehydrogenase [Deltaproteobacteria bacterium]
MIAEALQAELGEVLPGAVCFDVPGRRLTSLRIGGPADALAAPPDRAALARLLRFCARRGLRRRAMGRGFNTIIRDEGVDGVLIALSKLRRIAERPGGLLRVEAGVSHASLSHFCRERGLAGLEFGAGIPGSIGGWIAMNAGIPGREVKDVVRELEVMSPGGRRLRRIGAERLRFRYRGLAGLAPGSLVVSALLAVRPAGKQEVRAETARLLAQRAASQPLDQPSCGSIFKNPQRGSAGRLIEAAGLKGARRGGARISERHANFIVNEGGASAADVLALIGQARAQVRLRTGVQLEPEVCIWGRES